MQNRDGFGNLNIDTSDFEKISNEFSMVRFGKVIFGNGERLLIESPSTGDRVLLDSILLEAISSLGHEKLSQLLAASKE